MPLPTEQRPWSFYRLGPTKEKELFKRHRDTYDGVVIPAHIASYYHKFCSEFVGSLGKPYFIDPMTYIFANDPTQLRRFVKNKKTGRTETDTSGRKKKGDIKRSYSKLIEQDYQEIIKLAVSDNRRLMPRDFADADALTRFVQRIVEFQTTRLAAIPEKYRKYERYAEKAGKAIRKTGNPPMCVIAPYFPTTTLHPRGWHATNLHLVQEAKRIAGRLPVFAVILANPQVLAQDTNRIAEDYATAGADGFLLWPDGFSGFQAPSDLRAVFDAVAEFAKGEKPVILMYGDAFSLVLHYAGLAGFVCGICYGEHKLATDDIPVEGAIPPRYYLSRLKKKVRIDTELVRNNIGQYTDFACDCDICRRRDPATQDDTESREHFMLVRAKEIAELREGMSQADFTASLDDAFQQHCNDPLLQPIVHLQNWAALLSA